MKKGGGSESTIIIGPSKSGLVYALHSLEYVLGLARFQVIVPNYMCLSIIIDKFSINSILLNLMGISSFPKWFTIFLYLTDRWTERRT